MELRTQKNTRGDKIRNSQSYVNYTIHESNTIVKTDASDNGPGAHLEQLHGNDWKTVSFASKFLHPSESTIE